MDRTDTTEQESLAPRTPISQSLQGQCSGSQATSSNAGPAMFESADNVMITGGDFTASQGHRVTIIMNDSRIPRNSGAEVPVQNQPSAQNVAPSPNPNPNRNRRRRRPNRPDTNAIRPVQRSNEMYERHLTPKDRGFPLWIPQPNMMLPIPYRAKGVCIGDVGIITEFGGFDFLFNICRSRDDPINPEELPDNFVPIHPPLNPTDIRKFREFSAGSYLASSSIVESQTGDQTSGLTFESSASEGAILTMPDGAFQEQLGNLSKFRDYVAVHAANWYKFVNGPRGREAQNGDVRVVVGCDKATSWGMATFANTRSTQQSNFRLKFRPLQSQHNTGTAYTWEYSGVAEVRIGPESGENEELGETSTCKLQNQCLFMRTLSVTLSDSVWAETFLGTVSAIKNQGGPQPEYRGQQHLRPSTLNTLYTSSSSSDSASSMQGGGRSPGPSDSEIAEEKDKDDETLLRNLPWSSAPMKESAPSPPGDHIGSGSSHTHNLDDIRLEEPFMDKLYHMIDDDDPVLTKCITWTDSGTSFIANFQMFPESWALSPHNSFSNFVIQLKMYDFQVISRISPSNQNQTWEFSHLKFIRGRPDLLHEIKLNAPEVHWNPAMNDEVELSGDLVGAPAQLDAMQNETTRLWFNPSKIINKYLLSQVPDAKVALTHDRNWSTMTDLSPSELIKKITSVNDVTVDSVSGVVFLEPKNEITLLTVEEQSIIDQIEGGQITLEQYLFGSSGDHSMLLRYLISWLRLNYMPFRDQYTMPARATPHFLEGHPIRLLSIGDLVDIRSKNFKSLLEHRYIHRLRSQLNALRPDDPDKGTWLLRLAEVLSRRFRQLNQKDDLEEAIWYYEEALSLLPETHYHFLEAILGFCSCVYQRFQLLGHLDDLKKLLEHLHTEQNLNLESLLAPVKAQLQTRPQVTHKLSVKELSLNALKSSSNIDVETKWAKETEFWKPNSLEFAGDSELEVRSTKDARTTMTLDPAANSLDIIVSAVESLLDFSTSSLPVEHDLKPGASITVGEHRQYNERKWAVSQGNVAGASQMKRDVKPHTTLIETFNREAKLKSMEVSTNKEDQEQSQQTASSVWEKGRRPRESVETVIVPASNSMGPRVDIDDVPTSEITTTKTHKIAPPISVHASTLIPAVPEQLDSASSSAPVMPVSVNPYSSIFQGAKDVNLLHPTITVNNHACNAEANEDSRALSPEYIMNSSDSKFSSYVRERRRTPMACTNCRSRKLKCRPVESVDSAPCERCVKEGVYCEYRPVDPSLASNNLTSDYGNNLIILHHVNSAPISVNSRYSSAPSRGGSYVPDPTFNLAVAANPADQSNHQSYPQFVDQFQYIGMRYPPAHGQGNGPFDHSPFNGDENENENENENMHDSNSAREPDICYRNFVEF